MDEGDRVEAGQLLARLDDREAQSSLQAMQVQLGSRGVDKSLNELEVEAAGRRVRQAVIERNQAKAEYERNSGIARDVVADGSYPEADVSLRGRHLYIFSDGLTEACAPEGGQLGTRGVQSLISRFADRPLAERVQQIVASVGALDHRDDLTLLVVAPEDAAH